MSKIEVGQIYRDTYFDGINGGKQEHRTIRVTAIVGRKIHADTLTDCLGNPSSRKTRLSFKTLASGYVRVDAPVAASNTGGHHG